VNPPSHRKVLIKEITLPVHTWNPIIDSPDNFFTYVDISAIDSSSKEIVEPKQILGVNAPSRARQLVKLGDVLVSTVRPNLNSIAQITQVFDGATVSTGFCVLRPDLTKVSFRYLFHWVQTQRFVDDMARQTTGASYPAVTDEIIKLSSIPLPSLPEQQRIAAILDKADELRRKRRHALQRLDDLLQSVFLEMFGDPLNPKDQQNFKTLDGVADIIMGQSPPGISYNELGIGIPLLNGPTEFGKKVPIEKQWTIKPTRLSRRGDILFCVRGATAGRLNYCDKEYCLGRGVAAIRPKSHFTDGQNFLFQVLHHYYQYFQKMGVGSTFINISRDTLRDIKIPEATDEQIIIFDQLSQHIDHLKKSHEIGILKANNLFHSLQHQAFTGNLSSSLRLR
jgi:type I restriction enzyme, S subunit